MQHRFGPPIFAAVTLLVAIPGQGAFADQADAQRKPGVRVVKADISPPLRSLPTRIITDDNCGLLMVDPGEVPEQQPGTDAPDPVVQDWTSWLEIPSPTVSFDGPANLCGCAPPDSNGTVGPNHFVTMNNLHYAVYDKTGTLLFGPTANNTVWSGFGGDCETDNSGDPVVLYDQLADRWLLTQFTASGPTFFECVALSTSGDPLGTYQRYAISTGTNFPDYPKVAIWPDAYYVSTREFPTSGVDRAGAYAMDRMAMLSGSLSPTIIGFVVDPAVVPIYRFGDGLLPSDLDGFTPPPAGSPNYYIGSADDGGPDGAPFDMLNVWEFHADFVTPANSTFTHMAEIPIAPYDTIFPCSPGARNCIPQPATANKVDHQGYRQRPLFRAAYRNFGDHESIVTNQSVEAGSGSGISGIRWWELRDPGGSPTLFQEGTFAPGVTDGIHRWFGSIAQDSAGNMALGYSASDDNSPAGGTFPSVWYTGRLAGDPLGTMAQGEASIVDGTGSQTGSDRWGDYSSMDVDPVDDCTFWYTTEYIPVTSSAGWNIRIGAFRFDECGSPDFTLSANPASVQVCAPDDAVYTLNLGSIAGYTDPVTLSSSGEPAGTTVGFAPNPVIPAGSSTMTVSGTGGATAGSYMITVTGTGMGGMPIHTTDVGLDIFDGAPGTPTLVSPPDGATGLSLAPTLVWTAVGDAQSYFVEVDDDPGFGSPEFTGTTDMTSIQANGLSSLTTYNWRVTADNPCGPGTASAVFDFTTGDISTLLVDDDDNGPDVRATYTDALDNLGVLYEIWDTANSDNEPTAGDLASYSQVIWFTGDEFGGFAGPGAAGEAALATYLDAGGCLFLSSQDYHFDRGLTSFMTSYLGVSNIADDNGNYTGVTGAGSIFGGLGPYTLSYPFSDFSDTVTVGNGGELAMDGTNNNDAGTDKFAAYTTVFFGFPWEAIANAADRETVMQAALDACGNPPTTFTLTAAVVGSGTVTSSPPGINCPGDCTEDYTDGTMVTLTPTPASGWMFSAWSGDCTGSGACTVTMDQARSVTATFVQVTWTLDVSVTGPGTVTSSPAGINCPGDCTEDYVDGTPVGLTATPGPDAFLVAWGGDCSGTGACNVTMTADRNVSATFDTMPFLDGFESGDTSAWSSVVP